jgi:hypothetical protein
MKTKKTGMKSKSDHLQSAHQMLDDDNKGFVSNTLDLPEGCQLFKLDSKKPRRIDVLPYIVGDQNRLREKGESGLFCPYYIHRDIGPDRQVILCPKMTYGKRCCVCEEGEHLRATDRDDKVGKALRAKKRQLWNVVDTENPDAGVLVWDVSDFLFAEALRVAVNALEEGDPKKYYAALTDGYTLKLTVSENNQAGYTYYKVERVDFVERKKQYKESKIDGTWCLDDFLKPPIKHEALKKLFLQTSSDGEEEDSSESENHERNGSSMKRKSVTAKSKKIKVGTTVSHEDLEECTVLAISKDGFTLTLEDADGDEHRGIGVAEIEVSEETPKKKGGKSSGKKTKTKASKQEEEDEDSDDDDDSELEDDDDETDEEDSDDETDDDDEEGEDEDEDETPKKKRGRTASKKK